MARVEYTTTIRCAQQSVRRFQHNVKVSKLTKDPSRVLFVIVMHFPVETDDPFRPFCLNTRGEFENPSLTAIPVLFSGCMNAYGCIPDVTKNLFYSSVVLVDVLPCDGSSRLAAQNESHLFCFARKDYDTTMSQIAQASTEMLEEMRSIFRNF
jgi:hypothetical protein